MIAETGVTALTGEDNQGGMERLGSSISVSIVSGAEESKFGLGRYAREILDRVPPSIDVRLVQQRHLPLVRGRFGFLRHLPTGFSTPVRGSVVHFPRIMGCAHMLWRPVHPAIATVHDLGALVCPEDGATLNRFDRRIFDLQLRGLRRMDWWIVSSEQTRQHIVQYLDIPAERISRVQLGVDTTIFRPRSDALQVVEREFGLSKDPNVVDLLYVGSELPRKGLRYLIEAVRQIKDAGYRIRLLKAGGDGGSQWRAELEQQIRSNDIGDCVCLIGYVSDTHLPHLYNFADIYAIPTLQEGGFTWTAMEAMACARPVVTTTSALVREEAVGGALIIPPRDASALAAAVARLIEDEDLRLRLGTEGRRAVSVFTWEDAIQSLVKVYRHVASGNLNQALPIP